VVVDLATCFPVSMARGATWDVDLEEQIGEAIGRELRAVGADLYGGVCVNLLRHPAWGRAQETYGEDPCHVGAMGAALTRGVQRHAMACVKHFACNSMENARFQVDITVDEAALHEVYLPHFKRIVDEGVAVVMSAYNSVNGHRADGGWCGENRQLLTGVLRDEWGFAGFVISDWILGLRDAATSLHAGLDVEMPYRMIRAGHLPAALADGTVTWAEVDGAVRRVVATRDRFAEVLSQPVPGREVLACPEHRALAREAAATSAVLLRNEQVDGSPVLPLDPASLTSLALVGALADQVNLGDGGSSDVWAPEVATVADGLRHALDGSGTSRTSGTSGTSGGPVVRCDDGAEPARAATLAASADVAVVVVGYTRADEGEFIGEFATAHLTDLFPGEDDPDLVRSFESSIATERLIEPPKHVAARTEPGGFAVGGDRLSLRLHPSDVALIRSVSAANPRTVVVIVAGSAVVTAEWDSDVPAVVQAWYSGMEGGHGLADVLVGRVDASGRLPFSVPRDESDLPEFDAAATSFTYDAWHGYWYLDRNGTPAAYPFGFGLSYATFTLESAEVEVGLGPAAASPAAAQAFVVHATVANTGHRPGRDLVQVYARRSHSDRPFRLVGFALVDIEAAGRAQVAVSVRSEALAERDVEAHAMVVRPGTYDIRVARHAGDPGIPSQVVIGE
jgi:beta-glucosidase